MELKFLKILQQAKEIDVLDSGSILVFDDLIKECNNKIKKNDQQIQRLIGQNEQLSLMRSMITNIVQKYVGMQKEANNNAEEQKERLGGSVIEEKAEVVERNIEKNETKEGKKEKTVNELKSIPKKRSKVDSKSD